MWSRLKLGRGGTPAMHASLAWSAAHGVWLHHAQNSRTRRGTSDHSSCDRRTQAALESASRHHYSYATELPSSRPHVQAKGRAMALDDKTRTELEAATFRRLVEHFRNPTALHTLA